jgi:hypothetical protein
MREGIEKVTGSQDDILWVGRKSKDKSARDEISVGIAGGGATAYSTAFETLRFAVPAHATMRAFNGVTVALTPDVRHAKVGPRIAIRQFLILPR